MVSAGIVSYGIYIPEKVRSSKDVAAEFDLPLNVVETKQGISRKHVSENDEMPSEMGIKAAKVALEEAKRKGVRLEDIGALMYVGSQWKDYNIWLISTYLQEKLGLTSAFSFDMSSMCAGMVMGLYIAKSLLLTNKGLKSILLVGASKESYLVDPTDPKSTWMDDFADAGVAAVVSSDWKENIILDSDFMTDGSLSYGTLEITGGAKQGFNDQYCQRKKVYLESLLTKEELKVKLEEISLKNFRKVIESSVSKSGLKKEDVKMVLPNHMKPSFQRMLLKSLEISEDRSFYLSDFGHSQAADQLIALDQVVRRDPGFTGNVVLAAAGTGYVWGSTVISWG